MKHYDVVVVGAGVAGATAALSAAVGGCQVMVIQDNMVTGQRVGETLDPAARPLLESLGLWRSFTQAGHIPCSGTVSIWGSPGVKYKDFVFNPYGQAWQLDRTKFDEHLLREAEEKGTVIRRGERCEHFERLSNGWEVRLANETVHSTWLIDATGRRATVARQLGLKRIAIDRLVAVHCVATATRGEDQDARLFLEALPHGWSYSVLIPGERRVFSIQTDADLFPATELRDHSWVARCLRETTLLSNIIIRHGYSFPNPAQLTSAHSGRLKQFGGDGWLAVGDAAMSFDPLSGQGILKAMKSGMQAAEVVLSEIKSKREDFIEEFELAWRNFELSRRNYYAGERRWHNSAFWLRRGNPRW